MDEFQMALAEKLGLGTDASTDDLLAAVDALLSASTASTAGDDPTKAPGYKPPVDLKTSETVGMSAKDTLRVATLEADLAAKESRLAQLEADKKKGQVDAFLARNARKITGPAVEKFRKLGELDLAAAEAAVATLPDQVAAGDVTEGAPLAGTGAVDIQQAALLCRQKVRDAAKEGHVLSFTSAMKLATAELSLAS